jgi:adenylate cyclase
LEALATPGGICLSGAAYDAVEGKLDLPFEAIGPQKVKNIDKPVRVYRLDLPSVRSGPVADLSEPPQLRDKPSIAVLAFDNMSGDPEQEYFSDGITEDIITALSRFRELFVVARNSSFSYKGKSTKVQEIGRDLGVDYLVEGSVRKAHQRVRITVQLVEAASGNHIWAERYDRELEDMFDLQDEITQAIATVLPLRLQVAQLASARMKPSKNLTAYDCYLRARWRYDRTSEGAEDVLKLLNTAVNIDLECAHAHAFIAFVHAYSVFSFSPLESDPTIAAKSHIERALALAEGDHQIHSFAAHVYILSGEHDLASLHCQKALALNPNDFSARIAQGVIESYSGNAEKGVELISAALNHEPLAPDSQLEDLAEANYMARDYERALAIYQRWQNPPLHTCTHLAACYAQLGRIDEAHAAAATFEAARPEGSDFSYYAAAHIRMCKRREDANHWLDGYRKAGLID